MSDEVQISAYISRETKRKLDAYSRRTGVKKSRLIEDALEYHFRALDTIPAEYFVPTRIVLTQESWERVLEQNENPGEPSPELVALCHMDTHDITYDFGDLSKLGFEGISHLRDPDDDAGD